MEHVETQDEASPASDLSRTLAGIDESVLRQFQALCKGAQMQALFGRSPRLADWFQTVALIVMNERHRRKGKDMRLGDLSVRLRQHTDVLSQRDMEAIAMGFARMLEKSSQSTRGHLTPLIDLFYEPVRVRLMESVTGDG